MNAKIWSWLTGFDLAVQGALEAGDEIHLEARRVEKHLHVDCVVVS